MQYFTRRETAILTRTSLTRLAYLARTGMVIPTPSNTHPKQLHYSWNQILELRAICHLRRQVSLQMIRKILAFLERVGSDRALHNKHLIITDGEVTWLQTLANADSTEVQIVTKTNRHVGQLKLPSPPSFSGTASTVLDTARASKVVRFERFHRKVIPLHPDA